MAFPRREALSRFGKLRTGRSWSLPMTRASMNAFLHCHMLGFMNAKRRRSRATSHEPIRKRLQKERRKPAFLNVRIEGSAPIQAAKGTPHGINEPSLGKEYPMIIRNVLSAKDHAPRISAKASSAQHHAAKQGGHGRQGCANEAPNLDGKARSSWVSSRAALPPRMAAFSPAFNPASSMSFSYRLGGSKG